MTILHNCSNTLLLLLPLSVPLNSLVIIDVSCLLLLLNSSINSFSTVFTNTVSCCSWLLLLLCELQSSFSITHNTHRLVMVFPLNVHSVPCCNTWFCVNRRSDMSSVSTVCKINVFQFHQN